MSELSTSSYYIEGEIVFEQVWVQSSIVACHVPEFLTVKFSW